MTLRKRLEDLATQVKQAGISGASMQDELANVVAAHDLSGHEIRRIAEMANRGVQLELSKVAADRRFRFDLCEPAVAIKQAEGAAHSSLREGSSRSKVATAIDEAGGDPFAPLPTAGQGRVNDLSLMQHTLDSKVAYAHDEHRTRSMLLELDQARQELEAVRKEAAAAEVGLYSSAHEAHRQAVQSALDMLEGGTIKLPDLYMAIRSAVSGSRAEDGARDHVDKLTLLIIDGLKARGIPNHKLGFRFKGDIRELDRMSDKDLLLLCKRSAGPVGMGPEATDISRLTEKRAQRYLERAHRIHADPKHHHPFQDAAEFLGVRPSQSEYPVPGPYLDDENTSNTPNGQVRVVNADSEFVIGIQDLVGAQHRIQRVHAADEYLGLKLKQIEHTMRELQEAQKTAAAEYEQAMAAAQEAAGDAKAAAGPLVPLIAGVASAAAPAVIDAVAGGKKKQQPSPKSAAAAGKLMSAGKKVLEGLGSSQAQNAAMVIPAAVQVREGAKQRKHDKQMLKAQQQGPSTP